MGKLRNRLLLERAGIPQSAYATEPNPLVRLHGPGPPGKTCKSCIHLTGHQMSRRYYKCALRENTHGPGTDIRLKWRACGLWVPREG